VRRAVLIAVAAALAAALPEAASAAVWRGAVIAKDLARGAVVVTSPSGSARTVRAPARVAALRAGQRLGIRAHELADGTFASKRLRVVGKAGHARVRAVVVGVHGRRLTLSAGGTVFSVRSTQRQPAAAEGLAPGDVVLAELTFGSGGTTAEDVEQVGETELVELEGVVVEVAPGVLFVRLGDDLVEVALPADLELPPLESGDLVELIVAVGPDGGFTAVTVGTGEDSPEEDEGVNLDPAGEVVEAEGTLLAVDPAAGTVTLQPGEGAAPVTCVAPPGVDLSPFAPGDPAELRCELVEGQLVLLRLASGEEVVEAPGDDLPGEEPPAEEPPGDDPPSDDLPGEEPPAWEPPGEEPPGDEPPGDEPPGDEPPGEEPPGDEPPPSD
jgi:hypothetical protein